MNACGGKGTKDSLVADAPFSSSDKVQNAVKVRQSSATGLPCDLGGQVSAPFAGIHF